MFHFSEVLFAKTLLIDITTIKFAPRKDPFQKGEISRVRAAGCKWPVDETIIAYMRMFMAKGRGGMYGAAKGSR